jgi:tetratricopeptide (TPR) repeat protein
VSARAEVARRFARGEASRAEGAELVRALLLAGPPPDDLETAEPPKPPPEAYAAAVDAALRHGEALERRRLEDDRRAAELAAELASLSESEQAAAIAADRRFHAWPLVDRLRRASTEAGPQQPARARHLARLAVAAAERVPADGDDGRLREDLMGLAWAEAGNAERVASDLRAAEVALRRAADHLARGTGDPLPRARLLTLQASLRSDQSRFDEAVELAARAARLYRRAGDDHGCGRTLLKLATLHSYRDELEVACRLLERALDRIDAEREPRLAFAARHNRASFLERAGRAAEAAVELAAAEPLADAALDHLRVRWLAARIAIQRGRTAEGEGELVAVRREFLDRGLAYEAAQVSLELAVLYAEQGRSAEQRRLAEEMAPLFAARDVHSEARAALVLYCDAVETETASAALVRELVLRLDRAGRHRR